MALPVNGSTHLIPALLLIYRPRKDERLSWPSWLTYSRWFTHISGNPSAAGRAQDRESSPVRDRRSSTNVLRHHQRLPQNKRKWNDALCQSTSCQVTAVETNCTTCRQQMKVMERVTVDPQHAATTRRCLHECRQLARPSTTTMSSVDNAIDLPEFGTKFQTEVP